MLHSVADWRKRILEYFVARGNHVMRCSTKEKIFGFFGDHVDANTDIAFVTLLQNELIIQAESNGKKFYTIDFEKTSEIRKIIIEESDEEKYEMIQPQEEEFNGLTLLFTTASDRRKQKSGVYYYCVKQDDHSSWVVLLKSQILGNAKRLILGSFNDANSRIMKIWNATMIISEENKDGKFIRKQVEDVEKACGNNRQPSKAAFDIFVRTGLLKIIGKKGVSPIYEITGQKPPVENLDKYFKKIAEQRIV